MNNTDKELHQIYRCKDCGAIYNEEDIPSIRLDDYFRLFCNCQSENIELITE